MFHFRLRLPIGFELIEFECAAEMNRWEYKTLIFSSSSRTAAWRVASADWKSEPEIVGPAEKLRFAGKLWQAGWLLQQALEVMDEEGWELVSSSFSGLFNLYGVDVLRRPREA